MSDSKVSINVVTSQLSRNEIDISGVENLLCNKGLDTDKQIANFVYTNLTRNNLPYGIWTCLDGREVVFNRGYRPILQRKDGVNSDADRGEWVNNIRAVKYLYDDSNSPTYYLTKHLNKSNSSPKTIRESKKTLFICLKVLKDYSPEEGLSVNKAYSFI